MFTSKKKKELKRKEEERLAFEREFKEKTLVNKTLKNLSNTLDRYEAQKNTLIRLAKEAEMRGLKPQYNMATNGLKIVLESQDKVNAMYLNLTISNQLKEMSKNTKDFIDSMSTVSRQLSEIHSNIDFQQAQYDYTCAMNNIVQAEEKLQDFSDNVYSSIESYSQCAESRDKIDEAIDALIRDASTATPVQNVKESEDSGKINSKIRELEEMLHASR